MCFDEFNDLTICREKLVRRMTFYELTKIAAMHVLLANGNEVDTTSRKLSATDIWDISKIKFGDLVDQQGCSVLPEQQRETFIQYLSKHVRDPMSPINRDGQRMGFYVDTNKLTSVLMDTQILGNQTGANQLLTDSISKSRVPRESRLYPILRSWLVTQQYQAADVSNEKLGGKWGNPDLAGIRVSESFQGISLEILTIEAKISSKDWEKMIFEAVSHRRFANRAYFAYAEKKSRQFVQLEDIKYYAELFKVGILKIIMDDIDYEKLLTSEEPNANSSAEVEIAEVCSAPFNFVQQPFQLRFCENLGIKSSKDLYSWGKSDN